MTSPIRRTRDTLHRHRALLWARRRVVLFIVLIGGALPACQHVDDEGTSGGDTTSLRAQLVGTWVWVRQVEGGVTTLEITEEDLVPAVGPSGWPDCPEGIICTRYGIRKLRFEEDGTAWYIHNVHTSSDYEYPGHYTVSGDQVDLSFTEMFSCAHPDQADEESRTRTATFGFLDGELWVSVQSFGSLPFATEVEEEPTRWLVFRRITPEQYEDQYMIRICVGSDDACHPACFPERW